MVNTDLKIAVYLCNQPLPQSYDLDASGQVIGKRLVADLLPAEQRAIQLAKELHAANIMVVTAGCEQPKALLQKALALGADQALHIGDPDWPQQPPAKMTAAALQQLLGDEYQLIFCADQGDSLNGGELTACLGWALQWPAFNGVFQLALAGEQCNIIRKLEKGKRQQLRVQLPAVIGLLPAAEPCSAPSVEAQLAAAAKPLGAAQLPYALLSRQLPAAPRPTEYWQPSRLRPQTKVVWQPDSKLSGGQRLEAMAQGAITVRQGKQVSGNSAECAQAIIAYLLQEGFIEAAEQNG